MPNPSPGPNGLKPIITTIRSGFPDLNFQIDDIIISEHKIAVRCTMEGTHLGDLFGISPTGRKVKINQMHRVYKKRENC
jgi:predicted ester cyclase